MVEPVRAPSQHPGAVPAAAPQPGSARISNRLTHSEFASLMKDTAEAQAQIRAILAQQAARTD